MQSSNAAPSRSLDAVVVPSGPAALGRILPAVEAALSNGRAVLPLPNGPESLRTELLTAARPDVPLEEHDDPVALVVPTSGSEGDPKCVLLGAQAVRAAAEAAHARLGGPGRWLLAVPATHIAGLMVVARSVLAGTEPVALDLSHGFDPESFAAASVRLLGGSRHRRYTALVPRQLVALAEAGGCALEALAAYDAVLVGGSSVAPELLEQVQSAGVQTVVTYGMTETCGGCVYDGLPLDGVKAEIAGDGRVRLAGPMLAQGYRLRPDLTARAFRDGWFTTSDAGQVDTDGRLHVSGRVDDVAVSGGVNVSLGTLSTAVASHPQIRDAAAVALADVQWGQRVVAAVVARDPAEPPTLESVRAHVTRRLPVAYAPQDLVVMEQLPTLANGKVDRPALTHHLQSHNP